MRSKMWPWMRFFEMYLVMVPINITPQEVATLWRNVYLREKRPTQWQFSFIDLQFYTMFIYLFSTEHRFDIKVVAVRDLITEESMYLGEADCFVQYHFPAQNHLSCKSKAAGHHLFFQPIEFHNLIIIRQIELVASLRFIFYMEHKYSFTEHFSLL